MASPSLSRSEFDPASYTYVDEDSVDPELICSICHNPFVIPVSHVLCNNMFCASCIEGQSQCPLCRKLLSKDTMSVAPRPILNILDKLKVFCPICHNSLNRGELAIHIANCPVPCTLGCGEKVAPKEKLDHEKNKCINKIVNCTAVDVGCDFSAPRNEIAAHVATCKLMEMKPLFLLMMNEITKMKAEIREELAKEMNEFKQETARELSELRHRFQNGTKYTKEELDNVEKVLYALGGWDGTGVLNSVERYSSINNAWEQIVSMPSKRYQFGAAILDGCIYAIGGHNGIAVLNSVERFDPKKNTWESITPLTTKRFQFVVASLGGFIYAIGGNDGANDLNSVERFNPVHNRWETMASLATKRSDCGVAVVGDYIYCLGGNDGINSLTTMERYDPRANKWETVASMSTKRRYFGVGVIGDYLFAIGGNDGNTILNSVERYNTRGNKWEPVVSMPSCKAGCGVGVSNGSIYVLGGYDGSSRVRTVLKYDGTSWKSVASMQTKRSALGVVTL